jgi:hypothetical protein
LIPNTGEHNVAVFVHFKFLFVKNGYAIIIAKLTNGNEGGICNAIEDMGMFGLRGDGRMKWELASM